MYRKTFLQVNLDNLVDNYFAVKERMKGKVVIPVVKANAYGHGVIDVVKRLVEEGVNFFAVSLLEEALEIRKAYPNVQLLMMGVCNEEDVNVAAKHDIQVTIGSIKQVDYLLKLEGKLQVHMKIDTGMNRLGFKNYKEALDAYHLLNEMKHAELVGIYTHFATADNNYPYYQKQKARFEEFLSSIDYQGLMIHVSNSSSAIKYEDDIPYTTHVRLGISLYGLTLDEETTFLKNTCKLITHISEVKTLVKGEKVGYGITYEAKENERIGVLPIGYADGFIRMNQGGYVEINGQRCELVGRICMDQCFVRLEEQMDIDDSVVLFGGLISIDEVAKRLHTINYEVICQITSRVPRIYK